MAFENTPLFLDTATTTILYFAISVETPFSRTVFWFCEYIFH